MTIPPAERPSRSASGRRTAAWRPAVLVGVAATCWAIGVMAFHGYQTRRPAAEEANIAVHVALGHGFRSPMDPSASAPPSAWSPPAYPLVIAAAYRVFGIASRPAIIALLLINALFFGMVIAGTERLGLRVFGSRAPGLLAGALIAVHPLFLWYAGDFWDGFMALALFVWLTLGALWLGAQARGGRGATRWNAAALGGGLGLLALTNASYTTAYPVILALAFPYPRSAASRLQLSALSCAVCLAVVAPWTIRNYEAFGRFIPLRTGSAILMWLGSEPASDGWLGPRAYDMHPYSNPVERRSLLKLGEPAYNDRAFKRFAIGVSDDPVGYVEACVRRSLFLVFGNPTEREHYPLLVNWEYRGVFWDYLLLNTVVAALGMAGMVAARRFPDRPRGIPLLAASLMLPFIVSVVIDRYGLPLRWLLVFYTGALLWMKFGARPAERAATSNPSPR